MLIEEKRKRRKQGAKPAKGGRLHRRYYPFDVKYRAVQLYLEEGYSSKLIAEELGLGNGTIFEWVKRYNEEGEEGLRPRVRGHGQPKISGSVKEKAVELKRANPDYGSRRISDVLKRMFCMGASHETVRQTLKEQDLIESPRKKRPKNITRPRFFERATPNQMWQTDIFTFRLGGKNAYLIGFIDDYSRFIVGMGLYRSQKADQLLETYRRAAAEYRVPKEMLTDNGRQYTNWRGKSQFEKELAKDRIKHIKSSPHHPMTLGKIERFWKTIFGEFLSRVQFDSFDEAQERLSLWIKYYNYKRPHQGINGLCPADRFFEVQSEMKTVLSRGVEQNVLEMALRGKPQKPFYMVGRWGDQSVVLHAEKGKVKMMVDGEECKEEKKIAYELEEEVIDDHKEQQSGEDGEDREERAQNVHSQREVPGGAFDMVREAQALAGMQGSGCELDDPEYVAEESALCDAEVVGAEKEGRSGACSGAGTEAGEAAGEDGSAYKPDEPDGKETGRDPGCEEEINTGKNSSEDVILLRRDQVPEVFELLRRWEAERSSYGAQEGADGGGTGSVEGGVDNEGVDQADDGIGGGQAAWGESEDVLQVGETGGGRYAHSSDGPGLRATLVSGGWGEREYQEDGGEDAEAAAYGGAEIDDTNVYGR